MREISDGLEVNPSSSIGKSLTFIKNAPIVSTMKYNLSNISEWPHFAALVKFGETVTKAIAKEWNRNGFTHNTPPQVRIDSIGGRYIKLTEFEQTPSLTGPFKSRRVYCFVDLTNGDLLKGSWKAPVKNGVRANLNDVNVFDKFTVYGPAYLTGGGGFATVSSILK